MELLSGQHNTLSSLLPRPGFIQPHSQGRRVPTLGTPGSLLRDLKALCYLLRQWQLRVAFEDRAADSLQQSNLPVLWRCQTSRRMDHSQRQVHLRYLINLTVCKRAVYTQLELYSSMAGCWAQPKGARPGAQLLFYLQEQSRTSDCSFVGFLSGTAPAECWP